MNLGVLDLSENALTGTIPASLSNLQYLQYLDLMECQLSGDIPEEFSLLQNFKALNIDGNAFVSFPNMTRPKPLEAKGCSMHGNLFKCPIPDWTTNDCGATCS